MKRDATLKMFFDYFPYVDKADHNFLINIYSGLNDFIVTPKLNTLDHLEIYYPEFEPTQLYFDDPIHPRHSLISGQDHPCMEVEEECRSLPRLPRDSSSSENEESEHEQPVANINAPNVPSSASLPPSP